VLETDCGEIARVLILCPERDNETQVNRWKDRNGVVGLTRQLVDVNAVLVSFLCLIFLCIGGR